MPAPLALRRLPRRGLGSIDPLTQTGLVLYLRSDQPTSNDGATVASWPDLSGNGRTATTTAGLNPPIMRKTGANISPNGKQMVEFGVTGNAQSLTANTGSPANTNGYTAYVYYKPLFNAGNSGRGQVFETAGTFELIQASLFGFDGYPLSDQFGMTGSTTSANRRNFGAPTFDTYQTLTARWNSPSGNSRTDAMQLRVNGAFRSVNSNPCVWDSSLGATIKVGNNSGSGYYSRYALGALLVYSVTHTDTVATGIERYLKSYFES